MTDVKLEVSVRATSARREDDRSGGKAFGLFFDAARRSRPATTSAIAFSQQVLAFAQQSLKSDFEHARKVVSSTSIEEIATAQSELVKSQITGAEHHIRELARVAGSKT